MNIRFLLLPHSLQQLGLKNYTTKPSFGGGGWDLNTSPLFYINRAPKRAKTSVHSSTWSPTAQPAKLLFKPMLYTYFVRLAQKLPSTQNRGERKIGS